MLESKALALGTTWIKWFEIGQISQAKAAELAGISLNNL